MTMAVQMDVAVNVTCANLRDKQRILCESGRVQGCSFVPGHGQQLCCASAIFRNAFHLLPESIGAPEYQWELVSAIPPPRGSAKNG